jgi:hypothetical protein
MQRKYVTKKLVKKISTLTNDSFKQAITEVMEIKDPTDEQVADFMSAVRHASFSSVFSDFDSDELKDLLEKKEKVDELYLEKVIALPTQELNDILFLHKFSKPRRAERTLEAITSELARRALLNDSSQSDTNNTHGGAGVRSKSKSTSKTTNTKKSKTTKTR